MCIAPLMHCYNTTLVMRFEEFIRIKELLRKTDNPGISAHERVFPHISKFRSEALKRNPEPRLSAVAAIAFPEEEEASMVLIQRQSYDGVHSGQIGFPGGKKEKDDPSLEYTARRETMEEVGIEMESLEMISPLTEVYIPPSGFLVQPYLFHLEQKPVFIPDPREVHDVFTMPLRHVMDDNIFIEGEVLASNGSSIKTKYFEYRGKKIWGATAMMIAELKILLQEAKRLDQ